MANRFYAKGELKDKKILAALKQAVKDYDDGAIAEVHDVLLEIAAAIEEWEDFEHGNM